MHSEWRVEKFLKGVVDQLEATLEATIKKQTNEATLLKQIPKDAPCIHAAGALQLNA